MNAAESQRRAGSGEEAVALEIPARLAALSNLIDQGSVPQSFEAIEKTLLLAADLDATAANRRPPSLFPLARILSLLGRAIKTFDGKTLASAGPAAAAAVETVRMLIESMGEERVRGNPMSNLASGEILPPEKLSQAKPGRILLALAPEIAEKVASILSRFGHNVLIARSAADIFSSFGFSTDSDAAGGEGRPALVIRHSVGGSLTSYSLSRQSAYSPHARASLPDVLIGDMFSAGFAGFELQEFLKSCAEFIDTRMIVLAPFAESKCTARVIQLGADGYFGLDVEPSVLLARIESSIERRRLRVKRQLYVAALAQAREALEEELKRGADYVRCLLPGKISSAALSTDWAFIPSASLGGDLFGYHRLGDGRMVLFMIDVSGHGVQSALYSVTIFDVLRTEGLKDVDFGDPASVMRGLNHAFRMEERNNMLFTLWYGVWDETTRILTHASAGSPPAVLIVEGGGAIELKAEGTVAGADPDAVYQRLDIQVPRASRLFLFSDGIYEFMAGEERILGLEAFIQLLERTASEMSHDDASVEPILKKLGQLSATDHFQDDVSLLEVRFD
jgi:sigma-B regulation protein RsbU (phosphoserine phosphatase)